MTARLLTVALVSLFSLPTAPVAACTTGVVSGRVTPDGRPLLWKNRDTPDKNNQVVYSAGPGYAYVAVVNAGGTSSVWMGVNEKGFCIENSVIKDMPTGKKPGMGNGEFMKLALETCANVKEFEALLARTNETGRRTMSNYGVIDAEGGAAIFETGHTTFVKFDANDPAVAPHGYVVRSNFTMTGTGNDKLKDGGDLNDIYSGGRYLRAESLFREAAADRGLTHRFILRHCARDLADDKGQPLCGSINGKPGNLPESVDTTSTICRRTTASVGVFHGVRPGEDPLLTTMWVILGEPAFSVAVPCWVKAGTIADPLLGKKRSPLCSSAIALRKACYDEDAKKLQTAKLKDIWAETWKLEDAIFAETEQRLAKWRETMPATRRIATFHESTSKRAYRMIQRLEEKYTPATAPAPRSRD
jgi:hypothetical protein